MDEVDISSGILVDSTSVLLKGVWYSDGASNRATLVDLLDHVGLTGDWGVLVDIVLKVGVGNEARVAAGLAVLALVDRCTIYAVVVASCLIDRASLIGDHVLVHELEGAKCLTTMAAIISH